MKKNIFLMLILCSLSGLLFADEVENLLKEPVGNETMVIVPAEQHVTNKTAKVKIEYTPLTDEVRVYYTCHAVGYDQGEAMNTVLAVLKDFKEQNEYYSYKYLRRDSVKYYKDENTGFKWAMYQSHVKFYR
ncbi:MAG: hypothetical protein IJ312_02135 [Treponema sp.]|nr:hypothetical protein [Treponema sp.]